jgi:alkylated DNA repair dioxygenase AlkB
MAVVLQPSLFASDPPGFDPANIPEVTELADGAWFAYQPAWLAGDLEVFEALRDTTRWRSEKRPMYDRVVEVPRLTASVPRHGPGHPVLFEIASWLETHYGEPFPKIGMNWYRDGADSVAPHGDQVVRERHSSVMAILSLGARRQFQLTQVEGAGRKTLQMGEGDLIVMGGTIQRTWRHGVPKTTRPVGPRICVMFRPPWLE